MRWSTVGEGVQLLERGITMKNRQDRKGGGGQRETRVKTARDPTGKVGMQADGRIEGRRGKQYQSNASRKKARLVEDKLIPQRVLPQVLPDEALHLRLRERQAGRKASNAR